MRQAEEAINGAPISERQSVQLVKRLREVESALACACVRARRNKRRKIFDERNLCTLIFELCTSYLEASTV